jgi:hypothetical protein
VSAYVANAKKLLVESAKGLNPFDGMKPEVRTPRRGGGTALHAR